MAKDESNNKSGLINMHDNNSNLITQETYEMVRSYIVKAQSDIYKAVNSAMVIAYWNIGKKIYEVCGESERAEYGKQLLKYLSDKLTAEFGKGYTISNLKNMRQFYRTFQNRYALRSELSWTHYRSLIRVKDEVARQFYIDEAISCGWSSRQLDRQINSLYYQRILASKDKKPVEDEINKQEPKPEYEKIIKDPYVLLPLKSETDWFESYQNRIH